MNNCATNNTANSVTHVCGPARRGDVTIPFWMEEMILGLMKRGGTGRVIFDMHQGEPVRKGAVFQLNAEKYLTETGTLVR